MGQKTNPISNRIGITRGWDSNWCGGNYAEKIVGDLLDGVREKVVNENVGLSVAGGGNDDLAAFMRVGK